MGGTFPRVQGDICRRFGLRLRQLREGRGLSQEAFADLCDMDRTYLSGIERGVRNPSLRNVSRIATALQLPISQLFDGL